MFTLVLASSLSACGTPPSSAADSDSEDRRRRRPDPVMATRPPATVIRPATVTATATRPGDGDPTTTGDGDGDGLSCPLGDQPGVALLSPTLSLFADGDDPSGSPSCAVVNPERGFHGYVDLRTLDAGTLDDIAASGLCVVYGQVLLPEYRDSPLDAPVLAEIAAGFDLVRGHGMSVVPRFHYSDAIDEPDADLDRILGHIEQLTPILTANADVILTLHAGFIGAWGEWHSSQNGLDAPGPRKQILDALLTALPDSRTVSVRRPSFKQDAYAGPLDPATAHDGSPLARVGHVNDCFLASDERRGHLPGHGREGLRDPGLRVGPGRRRDLCRQPSALRVRLGLDRAGPAPLDPPQQRVSPGRARELARRRLLRARSPVGSATGWRSRTCAGPRPPRLGGRSRSASGCSTTGSRRP